ncbi:hypothetical protein EFW17_22185 [Halostreptopolyspora alba]|uniref:Uncharacterized protein n=2 Tax=Halostreptopolyspora alba TaxID=2487137 RepID=A0A3N0E1C2_9ACTN|nr:hypothetical protein EFW17_22185 [Nocardiopsaceae bacterium YIM 96095]
MERDLAPERLPAPVRHRLDRLDRLRDIWVERRCNRVGVRGVPGRRALLRAHARELLTLAGQGTTIPGARERERRDEDALVRMVDDCHTGCRLSGSELTDLARTLPDPTATTPLSDPDGQRLADAAAVRTHPIVRAAHLYLTCQETLERAAAREPATPPLSPPSPHRPLPWAVATLTLLRSTYPPLVMDHRLADAYRAAIARADARERLLAFVELLTDLQEAAMRGELSRGGDLEHPVPVAVAHSAGSLSAALHRCVLERARTRGASFALVLHELDPDARVEVTAGDIGTAPERGRCEAAAARALFRRGPGCRWTSLEVTTAETTLRLLLLVQDVGTPPTGVLAVTADAWLTTADRSMDVLDPACTDCVTLLPTDSLGDRRAEVTAFVDDTIARAIGRLTRTPG